MLKTILIVYLCAIVEIAVSEIIYPIAGTIWKVGQSASVSFKAGQSGETVSLFFNNDRSTSLGGGSIANGGTFQFTVPQKALSTEGGSSELVAVHRLNGHLQNVDNVSVQVVH
ncbi:hypothetical protein HMPREF1544_09956 [Mucor circinelloides 1006PhL]|uniref:Uncharacterized protein n=1 Tax=Mucor circinelloides f. circinelloides (strain 1006PhL) TaxID=1220926 RepID=S2JU49_MUCC1|nr:hypothetical protein HMPREF1544_09956 [Mucor circinelloides 1006PhL]